MKGRWRQTIIIIVTVFICTNLFFYVRDVRQDNAKKNQELTESLNEQFWEDLYILGYGVHVSGDKVNIAYYDFDENRLIVDLSYYNHYNTFGTTLSVDDVRNEYNNFCNKSGNYDRIKDFSEYDNGAHSYDKSQMDYSDYIKELADLSNGTEDCDDYYDAMNILRIEVLDTYSAEEVWALCDSLWKKADSGELD